jgi:hypothetical protein
MPGDLRCPIHPTEPVRRFGDVARCSYCGEIVAELVGTVPPGGGPVVIHLSEADRRARYVELRVVATAKSQEQLRVGPGPVSLLDFARNLSASEDAFTRRVLETLERHNPTFQDAAPRPPRTWRAIAREVVLGWIRERAWRVYRWAGGDL